MDQLEKENTAFTTKSEWFNIMPFGLCNAPAVFERHGKCLVWVILEIVPGVFKRYYSNWCTPEKDVFKRFQAVQLILNSK